MIHLIDNFDSVISASMQYGWPEDQKEIVSSRSELQNALVNYGLYIRESGNLAIDNGKILLQQLRQYQKINGNIPHNFSNLLTSFVETYHTTIVSYYTKYNLDLRNIPFEDVKRILESAISPYYDDFLELFLSLEGLISLSKDDHYLFSDMSYLSITKEWMQGDILLEMIMLWGILNTTTSKYYFSYDHIGNYVDVSHHSFKKNIDQLIVRVEGILVGVYLGRYKKSGNVILQQILTTLYNSCHEEQCKIDIYEGDREYLIGILNRLETSIQSALFSSAI